MRTDQLRVLQHDKISMASVEILFIANRQLHTFNKIPTGISVKIDIDSRFHTKMLRALNSPPKVVVGFFF